MLFIAYYILSNKKHAKEREKMPLAYLSIIINNYGLRQAHIGP